MKLVLVVQLTIVVVVCLFFSSVDARVIKRSTQMTYCSGSTPCGWEIYQPATRSVEYFVKSPCDCPSGTECLRYSDDISIAAYVFRCRQESDEGQTWTN
ncbi:unnamed protein product [Larinioides sclopetarius]|uniref:Uncharacterized protein n=1 Tax=Larinioides sclopetarius TaxID=280406 RepID=A0AAV1Z8U1_9ARAC